MAGDRTVALVLDGAASDSPEAYRLDIAPDRIVVRATTPGGVFNGLQQLFRLLPPEIYARRGIAPGTTVPCLSIVDSPRFAYRGMMLDVARTWMEPAALKRYVDLLSYHGINKLHLHLSDDEGWRIEIRSHPELAAVGGFRGGDSPVRPVYGKWDEKYGGYYTQEQMRELIAYAALRNIEIIPEIDLPGHSRCIASVRPEIRCDYPADTASTNGYDYRSAWCVAREENYALLEDILGELCALFPSEYIHIGGDEVDAAQWQRCPDCRALMRQRGIDDPHRLEDLFMERVAAILARRGKRPAVWNEAVRTGAFARDCRVYGWESVKACLAATEQGYPTVVMPGESFYFDMRQIPTEEGHDWAAIFDARKTFGFRPRRPRLHARAHAPRGRTARRLLQRGLHRPRARKARLHRLHVLPAHLRPVAHRMERQRRRVGGLLQRADRRTLRPHGGDGYPLPALSAEDRLPRRRTLGRDGRRLGAVLPVRRRLQGAPLHPAAAHRTAAPIPLRRPTRHGTQPLHGPQILLPHDRTRPHDRDIDGESAQFPYTNASTYRGIARTRRACRQNDWVLYTFAEPVRCREMFLQTGNRQLPKTILTTGYAEVSYDGRTFRRIGDLERGASASVPTVP